MKWLIVPTQAFSADNDDLKSRIASDKKARAGFDDLPWFVKLYLKFFKEKVFVIHDEISWVKSNAPMPEQKKSLRSQVIKVLEKHSEARCGMTGTLMTKSPCNIIDPYQFLSASFFEDENIYDIAEQYSIMMSLRAARGRRVMISQKEWDKARKRLINAYKLGGEVQLNSAKFRIFKELGLREEDCEHILTSRTYTPFKNIDALMRRVQTVTMTVERKDIFDIKNDKFVYTPIQRYVNISEKGKRLGNELVKVGFTDNIVLGKAKALELLLRLQDLCNGFEPIENIAEEDEWDENRKRKIEYVPLGENPKLDCLEELLDEIGYMDNQIVVWCSRRNAFDSIEARLTKMGVSFVSYSGKQNTEEKKEAEEKAKSGEARVFLANPRAAAFGLNCLKAFNYMVWYCVGPSVEEYHQAQHRLLRGESKNPKFAYQISIRNSVEQKNYRTLNAGQELLSAANSAEIFKFG